MSGDPGLDISMPGASIAISLSRILPIWRRSNVGSDFSGGSVMAAWSIT
jgi:hypothetical protein